MAHPDDEPQVSSFIRELQDICDKVDGEVHEAAMQLRRMVERLKRPNLPEGAYGLPFRIYQIEDGERTELVSLNGHIQMAQAAFDALIKIYPYREWELRWGMMKPRHHLPELGIRTEPLDGTND